MARVGNGMRKVGAMVGAVVLMAVTGCSADGEEAASQEPGPQAESATGSTAEAARDLLPGMHEAVAAEGVTLTVESATLTDTVELFVESGYTGDTEMTAAREDGVFLVVETTVRNDSLADMDLSCAATGTTVHTVVRTATDAVYQPQRLEHRTPGNPECNRNLGAGFDAPMTWIYLVPEGDEVETFGFAHQDSQDREEPTWIRLDRVEQASGEPAGKVPSTTRSPQAEQPSPTPPPAPTMTERPVEQPAPAPAAAPAYGQPCSAGQALQPATGPDGAPLVCAGMGQGTFTWVYGPAAQEAGSGTPGGTCLEGEEGARDGQGRMMMCLDGEWIYGP